MLYLYYYLVLSCHVREVIWGIKHYVFNVVDELFAIENPK